MTARLPLLLAAAILLIGGGARVVQATGDGLGWLGVGAGLSAFGTWLGLEVKGRSER
jgi:hypothetical protein